MNNLKIQNLREYAIRFKLLLLWAILMPSFSTAQTVFSETFNEPAGSTTGNDNTGGVLWTSSCPSCLSGDWYEIVGGRLQGLDTNGPATFESGLIDISGCQFVQVLFDLTDNGTMEACNTGCNSGDWVAFQYNIDGSGWQDPANSFFCAGGCANLNVIQSGDIAGNTMTYNSGCLGGGTTLQIRIIVQCWAAAENWEVDNINVSCTTPIDLTITPAGPFCDTDASVFLTAASGGGTWSGTGIVNAATGEFDPAVAGPGVFNIQYTVGTAPCVDSDIISITVNDCSTPCFMNNLTANVGFCIPGPPDLYSTSGIVEFTDPPATGQLIVEDCNGNQDVFNPPFVSPSNYTISGQAADGLPCDITAYFTDDLGCTSNVSYTAPSCPCNIDVFDVTIGTCNQLSNTYQMTGDITFTSPPATGTMIVEVFNGTTTFDTIINLPFVSPQAFSISGIPADGAASTITVYFSDDVGCTSSVNYSAPFDCSCNADIGTFTATMTGSSANNYVLCFGDGIDILTNNDWVAPDEQFSPPGPLYNPGVTWLIYSCPPTIGVIPQTGVNVSDDPCFLGLATDNDINDLNNGASWFDVFPPGTFTGNTVYFVPLTFYDQAGGTYSFVNGTIPCYEMGSPFAVQYLPEFTFSFTENCLTGQAVITVNGGLPEVDGSSFTASNLSPGTAAFSNTTALDGGTITITGLQGGDLWSFDVLDGNGCPYTVSGGPFPPLEDPSFSYPQVTYCTNAAISLPIITGTGGGSFAVSPAGLTINGVTGQITPATSTPGTYDVTYTTPGACFDASTVQVIITPVPTVNPVTDQTVCDGDMFVAINFSGTNSPTFNWTNDNTNIGLVASGTGNIASFQGTAPVTQEVSNITVTPVVGSCTGTPETFMLTVNPLDDASFNYAQTTFCTTDAGLAATITGTAGGTFTVSPLGLTINAVTGMITPGTSTPGSYDVTYTTSGACPDNSVVGITIVNTPVVNPILDQSVCHGDSFTPINFTGTAGTTFTWSNDNTATGLAASGTGNIAAFNGTAPVMQQVSNVTVTPSIGACVGSDEVFSLTINPLPTVNAGPDQNICEGTQVTLSGTGALNYSWNNGVTDGVPFAPVSTLTYTVTGTDANGCEDTDQATIAVNLMPTVDPLANQSICEGDDLTVQAFIGTPAGNTYNWVNTSGVDVGFGLNGTGNIGSFTGNNGSGVPIAVTVQVTPTSALGCVGNPETFVISVNPIPIVSFFGDPVSGCEPLTVSFTNTTSPVGQNCQWSFGDGSSTVGCGSVSNTYNAGSYDVSLTVTTAEGCTESATYIGYINVSPQPHADFSFTPQVLDVEETEVIFTNNSSNADTYLWNFGDGTPPSTAVDPTHEYPDFPQNYTIVLTAIDASTGCADTAYGYIQIKDVLIYYVPNAFTPDGNDFNEVFQPVFTAGYDPYNYHLMIFNRWGELLFESYNPWVGWDGTYGDGGLVKDGVYIWAMEFGETMSDKIHKVRGHVTVLK